MEERDFLKSCDVMGLVTPASIKKKTQVRVDVIPLSLNPAEQVTENASWLLCYIENILS